MSCYTGKSRFKKPHFSFLKSSHDFHIILCLLVETGWKYDSWCQEEKRSWLNRNSCSIRNSFWNQNSCFNHKFCFNQTSFGLFFHFEKSEILLKSKILHKSTTVIWIQDCFVKNRKKYGPSIEARDQD
jgi:hypothetical protein